ncbi:hypothetical protein XELAEV_18021614mg [Xenopus laevis]|uniref:Helix-turn-helix domain-containing protein n=1 Tax=Xenopus laevis TaxID=8355 RepID=A0A974DAS2_XENLA|nr:hypothetical protein XELAEV_18021614mg [Xenopus laevis]
MDVSSLYTCIPHSEDLDAIEQHLHRKHPHRKHQHEPHFVSFLCLLLQIGLTKNYFSVFLQKQEYVNRTHNTIKFVLHYDREQVEFLDVCIKKEIISLSTTLYRKSVDKNSILHYDSFHPPNTMLGLPKSQLMTCKCIASNEIEYKDKKSGILNMFKNKGYPRAVLQKAEREVERLPREILLTTKDERIKD